MPAVSGLEEEFPGRVKSHNVDATTAESKEAVAQLGFRNHGIVIRSAAGEVLWTQPDHQVEMEDVRAKLKELTGG